MLLQTLLLTVPAAVYGAAPTVTLGTATITGIKADELLDKFLGIPFAAAPRFDLPVPIATYVGDIHATEYGPSCPEQLNIPAPQAIKPPTSAKWAFNDGQTVLANHIEDHPQSEDCLSINVIKPSSVEADAGLPVVVWIFGGGFQGGNTVGYDPWNSRVVTKSITTGKPIIHVSMNYRTSAYGFLASSEVGAEGIGNFGLVDQRVALRWVKKYINRFGGDPNKVTLWGQSAGAMSVALQMLAYGGQTEGLFRGAFMQSGAPIPVSDLEKGQEHYDALVEETGCTEADSTLDCLRSVDFDVLKAAVDKSPACTGHTGLYLAWAPRVDGTFLINEPYKQVEEGLVANIPIVTGNVDDEGTLFSTNQTDLVTDEAFRNFITTLWAPDASPDELADLWTNYTSTPADGSPFATGDFNQLYPQFKRLAAFQGDLVFQAPRRHFIKHLSGVQKIWTYLSKVSKLTPYLGAYHASDLNAHITDDHLISFAYNLNPNTGVGLAWPEYTTADPKMLIFHPGYKTVGSDTYRQKGIEYLRNLGYKYPL